MNIKNPKKTRPTKRVSQIYASCHPEMGAWLSAMLIRTSALTPVMQPRMSNFGRVGAAVGVGVGGRVASVVRGGCAGQGIVKYEAMRMRNWRMARTRKAQGHAVLCQLSSLSERLVEYRPELTGVLRHDTSHQCSKTEADGNHRSEARKHNGSLRTGWVSPVDHSHGVGHEQRWTSTLQCSTQAEKDMVVVVCEAAEKCPGGEPSPADHEDELVAVHVSEAPFTVSVSFSGI